MRTCSLWRCRSRPARQAPSRAADPVRRGPAHHRPHHPRLPTPTRVEGEGSGVWWSEIPPQGPAPPKRAGFVLRQRAQRAHTIGTSSVRPLAPSRSQVGGRGPHRLSTCGKSFCDSRFARQDRTLRCGLPPSLGRPGPPRATRQCRRRLRKNPGGCQLRVRLSAPALTRTQADTPTRLQSPPQGCGRG